MRAGQIIGFLIGLAIMVGIFVFAIPKFADYGDVFAGDADAHAARVLVALRGDGVQPLHVLAREPGRPDRHDDLAIGGEDPDLHDDREHPPAGGALAIAMTAAILSSWGFTAGEITLFVGVTGIWNIFAKLALPVVALALLVLTGNSYPALLAAAAVGVVVLVVAIVLLVLVFKSEAMARKIGHGIGSLLARVKRLFGKQTENDLGDKAVRFRRETIILAAAGGSC